MIKNNALTKESPNRVVVMGAGGFIGASLINSLQENKIPFLGLSENNLNLFDADASYRLADILNPDDTLVVISAIAPCKNNEMLLQNISMVKTVCEAIENQQPKHVVYLSSDAVYADNPNPITEASSAAPGSLHGVMHLSREIMLKQSCSVPMAIIRPSLIYGAEDTHGGYGPNLFLQLGFANKKITLFGEGEEQRDHVYVDDVVKILQLIILHRSEGVLNVATGTVVSFKKIAEMVSAYFNPNIAIVTKPRVGPMPHNGYRPFDPASTLAAFPGFKYTTLADGINKTFKALNS